MAKFIEGEGIILTEEEKETFGECNSFMASPEVERKRKTMLPNLMKALDDGFIGWEIK